MDSQLYWLDLRDHQIVSHQIPALTDWSNKIHQSHTRGVYMVMHQAGNDNHLAYHVWVRVRNYTSEIRKH